MHLWGLTTLKILTQHVWVGSEIPAHSRHENLTQLGINVKSGGSISCFYLGRLWLLEHSVWEHTAFMSVINPSALLGSATLSSLVSLGWLF